MYTELANCNFEVVMNVRVINANIYKDNCN